jgi:hypothetical protein
VKKRLGPGRLLRPARSQPGKGGQTPASLRILYKCTLVAITIRMARFQVIHRFWHRSDQAAAQRGDEMDLAIRVNRVENAAGGNLAVDGDRD